MKQRNKRKCSGLRTYKETEDTTSTYEWDEDILLRETVKYNVTGKMYDIWYLYNSNKEVIGFEYNYLNDTNGLSSTRIYYEKDIQGNVIGLLDCRGAEIAKYSYDAWGNIVYSMCYEGYEIPYALNHITYAVGASAAGGSGIVLWSGGGMQGAGGVAQQFAIKNGLKTLEMTKKGKLLTSMNNAAIKVLGKTKGYKFMKPLWNLGSKQFVKSAKGSEYVHVFLSVSNFSSESVFAKIEYTIVRELGIKIIWHFIK